MSCLSIDQLDGSFARHLGSGVTPAYARELRRAFLAVIATELGLGNEVVLPGIGRLGRKRVGAKTIPHPRTGDPVDVEAHWHPKVTWAPELKRKVAALPIEPRRGT